jgi:hypothetical protein
MQNLVGALVAAVSLLLGPAGLRADDQAWKELPETVEGYGETPEAAKSVALSKARDAVAQYLAANFPQIRVDLSAKYLERKEIVVQVRGLGVSKQGNDPAIYHVVYRINKLTDQQLGELRDRSRVPWMYQRHREAALVLAGLVLALLALMGYLRLDEATHGYYAGRLLGAAVVLVALAVLALWWWL